MKLTHPKIETCFRDGINTLVVENPQLFRDMYADLAATLDGDCGTFVLSDGDREVNLSKTGLFIGNPIDLVFNDRKTSNVLLNDLADIANEKYAQEVSDIGKKFSELFDKLNSESAVQIDWFDDSPVKALLKAFNVAIKDDYDSYLEKLINYLTVATDLLNVGFVAFVNLKSYFTESELSEVFKLLRYNNVFTLLLESCVREKSADEFRIIIDRDLCEIIA